MPVTLDRQKIAAIRAISAMQFDEQRPRKRNLAHGRPRGRTVKIWTSYT